MFFFLSFLNGGSKENLSSQDNSNTFELSWYMGIIFWKQATYRKNRHFIRWYARTPNTGSCSISTVWKPSNNWFIASGVKHLWLAHDKPHTELTFSFRHLLERGIPGIISPDWHVALWTTASENRAQTALAISGSRVNETFFREPNLLLACS